MPFFFCDMHIWGVDLADQFPSGYTGMGNDPANMVDPSGMWSDDYGIHTDPKIVRGVTGRTLHEEGIMREEAYQYSRRVAALSLGNKVQLPDLSHIGNESQAKAIQSPEEMNFWRVQGMMELAQLKEGLMNKDVILNGFKQTDEVGKVDGVFEIPGIGKYIGELADKAKELFERYENGEIDYFDMLSETLTWSKDGIPTKENGGVIRNSKDFYDYMLNQAGTNSVEVSAWRLTNRQSGESIFFVEAWNNNGFDPASNRENSTTNPANIPEAFVAKAINRYFVNGQFHTHLRGSFPSRFDEEIASKYGTDVHVINSSGSVYKINGSRQDGSGMIKYPLHGFFRITFP